jgi:hypothetical protein
MSHVTTNKWNSRYMYNMYIFLVDLLDIFITVIAINLQFLNNVIIIKSKVLWKLNQTVLELDLWADTFLFFPRRDLNSHHWYTAAPIA